MLLNKRVLVKKQAKKTPAVIPDIPLYRRIGTKNVWRIKGVALAAGFYEIVCLSGVWTLPYCWGL